MFRETKIPWAPAKSCSCSIYLHWPQLLRCS